MAPRNDSEICFKHKKIIDRLSPSLKVVWLYRSLLPDMLPCDVAALDQIWESLADDLVLETLASWIKEPTTILKLVELKRDLPPGRYSAAELLSCVLLPLVRFMHGRVNEYESDNLHGLLLLSYDYYYLESVRSRAHSQIPAHE